MIILSLAQISAAIPPWSESFGDNDGTPLSAILADPGRYHGKTIRTSGYLILEYEGDTLWFSKTDSDQFISENRLWIDGPEWEEAKARRRLNGQYVTIEGVFRADSKGHLGASNGTIVAKEIDAQRSRRKLSLLYDGPVYLVTAPWPPIIAGLLLLAGIFAVGRRRRPTATGGITSPGAWIALAGVMTVFSAVRVRGSGEQAYWALQAGMYEIWTWFSFAEAVVGLFAAIGMWWALKSGRRTVLLIFVLLQLAVPAARELARVDTWRSQMTYPFVPAPLDRHWEHPGWPPSEARMATTDQAAPAMKS